MENSTASSKSADQERVTLCGFRVNLDAARQFSTLLRSCLRDDAPGLAQGSREQLQLLPVPWVQVAVDWMHEQAGCGYDCDCDSGDRKANQRIRWPEALTPTTGEFVEMANVAAALGMRDLSETLATFLKNQVHQEGKLDPVARAHVWQALVCPVVRDAFAAACWATGELDGELLALPFEKVCVVIRSCVESEMDTPVELADFCFKWIAAHRTELGPNQVRELLHAAPLHLVCNIAESHEQLLCQFFSMDEMYSLLRRMLTVRDEDWPDRRETLIRWQRVDEDDDEEDEEDDASDHKNHPTQNDQGIERTQLRSVAEVAGDGFDDDDVDPSPPNAGDLSMSITLP